ncbi:MAG TPA: AmmeMemoRadiSam system protein B [Thermoanaerobaculia bacterium]|nr:AmmeMemoRadiSam system protein B [Thermoanaerobaculia bacterium]
MPARIRVRPAAVAGLFYPGDPVALRSTVEALLGARSRRLAEAPAPARPRPPKALIAPHAGYSYSGPIAASAFAALGGGAGAAGGVRRVVLLGPSHRVPLRGLGLPGVERFATPLGEVPVDLDAVAAVERLPQVAVRRDAHLAEHSLEVELPFLQVVLGRFELLPLVAGEAGADEVAEVLEQVWGGDDTVLVISSDLSHYLPAAAAERADAETAAQIRSLAGPLGARQACGAVAINGLLPVARRRRLVAHQLDLRHSGDTSGDRSRVVGYGAWAFSADDPNDADAENGAVDANGASGASGASDASDASDATDATDASGASDATDADTV